MHVSSDGALKIEQARNTDVGLYSCNIRLPDNSTVTKKVKLEVTELPHSPINVKTEVNVAGGLVNVSWSPPFDGNSPIIRYIVEKRVVKNGDPSSSSLDELSYNDAIHGWARYPANISASQRFALLTNLRPAMTYQFRVLAVNSVGEGPPSAPSNPPVTVPAQPPAGSPIGVVGAPRSATSIIIQWQPPPNDAHNGLLQGYIVRYKLAGYADTQWYYHNVTNAAQFSCLLDDLIVWRNYEIGVAAYNDMGTGAYSSSIFIRTKEGKPAAPPRNVEATAINSTAIRIRWNQTDPQLINGINQGYKVQAFVFDGKKGMNIFARELIVTPHALQDEGQEATFTDLSPHTQYFISVLCFTSAGDGPPNEPPILVTTLEDLPESVHSFKFSDVKDTSLRLTWSPPEKVNGELLGYTLKYCSVLASSSSPCEWKHFNYSSNIHESVITDLKPDTTYTFEINAVTRIGPGPSLVANVKSSVAPVEIGDLLFSDITMSRVRVSWAPPILNQNVTLVGYHVEYETQSDFGKQVKQRITNYYLVVSGLKERATYTFRVRAETLTGLGPEKIGIITTGPQPGSPAPPLSVNLTQTSVSVRLKWINSAQLEPLIGYLIEGKQVFGVDGGNGLSAALSDEDSSWQPIVSLRNGPQSEYDLSFNHLSPSSRYTLRIMSVNSKGISEPAFPVISGSGSSNRNDSHSKSIIITPSHLAQLRARLPFYKEAWFVILCASMTVVFTIMVIAILCVQSKAYQYKQEVLKHGLNGGSGSRDALSESHYGLGGNQGVGGESHYGLGGNLGVGGNQGVGGEEGPYAGLELRANHPTISGGRGRSSLALDEVSAGTSGGATGGAIARTRPRPAPGSLSYSDEEDVDYCDTEAKESNFYGSSGDSLTEKPSELSSSGPDSESDHDGAAHFVNHYANVNDTLRKGAPSWKSQGHPYTVRPPPSHRTLERRRDHHLPSSSSHHSSLPQSSGSSSHSQNHHSQGNHSQYNNHHNYPPPPQEYLHHQQQQVAVHSSQYNPRSGSDQRNMSSLEQRNVSSLEQRNMSSLSRREGQQMSRERQQQQDRPSRPAPPVPGRELPGAPPSYFSAVAGPSSSSNGNDDSDQLDSPSVLNHLGSTAAGGGRIIVNNMAGSRAPLPGFSSFV